MRNLEDMFDFTELDEWIGLFELACATGGCKEIPELNRYIIYTSCRKIFKYRANR